MGGLEIEGPLYYSVGTLVKIIEPKYVSVATDEWAACIMPLNMSIDTFLQIVSH